MAAKTIDEVIDRALMIGPIANFSDNLKYHLRDYFAHRVMILGEEATAMDLFNDVFKDIPAVKEGGEK